MKRGVLYIIGGVALLLVILFIVLNILGKPKTAASQTLTIWSPFDEKTTYDTISAEFLKKNAGVSINFQYIAASDSKDYEAKVVNAIANGNGPDIWLARNDWIPKHVAKSEPAPDPDKKTTAVDQYKTLLMPSVVDMNSYGGKLYGVPLFGDSLALIVNSKFRDNVVSNLSAADYKVFNDQFTTWTELTTFVNKLKQVSGTTVNRSILAMGNVDNTYGAVDVLSSLLVKNGVSVLSTDNSSVAFNLAKYDAAGATSFPAIASLDYYTSFAKAGNANYNWNSTLGDPVTALINSKTMMMFGYYSTVKDIVKKNPDLKLSVVAYPQDAVNPDNPVYFGVTWSHLVNASSSKKTLAWDYLNYLVSGSTKADYNELTDKPSVAYTKSFSAPDQKNAVNSKSLFENQLKKASSLNKLEWQTVDQILQDTINQVITYNQTPQNSIDTAASRFKEELLGQK